jgi:hypothetical protein
VTTIETMGAQGDLLVVRVEELPPDAARVATPGDRAVLAHSETGHHHAVESNGLGYYRSRDPLVCYLTLATTADVVHERPWDTHAALTLGPGVWQVRRQREWTIAGHRRVED